MKYYAIHFHIDCDEMLRQTCRELLADSAGEVGFESFEDADDGLMGYVPCNLLDEEALKQQLADFPISDAEIRYEIHEADDQDWNETWEQEGFNPIIIDERCVIYDARKQGTTPLCSHIAPLCIGIEARMAFGTGTHETTRMVVRQLLDTDMQGKRVLDCGCGTGILAIVAAKQGAAEVVAYDIDEWSVENARHNAALNGAEHINVLHGDASVLSHVSGVFDVVVANINRNILLADLPQFAAVMATGGTLILSGFYEEDIPMLVNKAAHCGLQVAGTTIDSQWACVKFLIQ